MLQREALDRLSNQILSIQDKVYEAAIKSVDSLGARMQTRACKFISQQSAAFRQEADSSL